MLRTICLTALIGISSAAAAQAQNIALIVKHGHANVANVDQMGYLNFFVYGVHGDSNSINISQTNSRNTAIVIQRGGSSDHAMVQNGGEHVVVYRNADANVQWRNDSPEQRENMRTTTIIIEVGPEDE